MTEIAHRFDVGVSGALEIASLVRAPGVSITAAAQLIEQYARTKASEATLDAITKTSDRMIAAMEAPLSRREPTDA